MENQNFRQTNIDKIEYATVVGSNTLLRSVFAWMTAALTITTVASMLFALMLSYVTLLIKINES